MISIIAVILLFLSIILQIVFLLRGRDEKISIWIYFTTSLLLYTELIIRSIQISFPAITNTFEALLFFAASILLILSILKFRKKITSIINFGAGITALILLLVSSSPIAPKGINPPIPALQSNWLLLHVGFSFIGQAFFVISFIAAICFLVSNKKRYEDLVVKSIIIGYPIYTAGAIIFGSIWASSAWGSFWSWDPKETWALITWFIYTIYLHGRYTKYIKGRFLSWLSIIGFIISIFTFFGVNFLLSSLHSYN